MKGLRYALSVLTLVALAGSYAGSQVGFFRGTSPVHGPWMRWAGLAVLVGAIVFALMPGGEDEP